MTKEQYKNDLVEDGCVGFTDNILEAIYIIDGLMVDGEFGCGLRGVDHNVLLVNGADWVDVLNFGTIIVHETNSYISNVANDELDSFGYLQMPLDSNHIVGF